VEDFEAASLGVVESTSEIPPFAYLEPNPFRRRQCVVGSLTGVVASKRVTEASKGALSTLGNRAQSAMA
jgi:hypothetical protein